MGERSGGKSTAELTSSSATSDAVVGFKPLMYFCFDKRRDGGDTVAVTCPKTELRRKVR